MATIGIENISVFGLPPIEFVTLAADLGCRHISTGLTGFDFGVCDYPPFSLRDDASLRREMIAVMRDRGISISLGEGFTIREGSDARAFAADLDIFVELGAERINMVSMDSDLARTCDQFAIVAELAAERDLRSTTEFVPSFTVGDLPTALEVIRRIGRDDIRLLIDTMHLVRSGGKPADIAALDPELIDYIQICDAPFVPRFESYFEESMYQRMIPGEGELGLGELVAALPADRVYSIEVPLRAETLAGATPHERLGQCVAAVRRILADAHGESQG